MKSKKSCSLPSTDSYSVDLLNFPPLLDPQVPIMNSSYQKESATWSHHQTRLPPSTRIQGRRVLVVPANQFSHSRIVTDARMLQIPSNILLTALPTPHGVRTIFGINAGQMRVKAGENVGLNFFGERIPILAGVLLTLHIFGH